MSIVVAVIIFGILIFIHEFGHFIMAKKNGIYVVEFSIGMGPSLFKFKKGETTYSLKLLPFGGACQMLNKEFEDENVEEADYERAFETKSVWARMVVIAAGPVFNFVLAFVLALMVIGIAGYDKPEVTMIVNESSAAKAGLKEGDIVTKYNGKDIDLSRELYLEQFVNPTTEKEVELTVLRDGKEVELTIKPEKTKSYVIGMSYTASDDKAVIEKVAEGGALDEVGVKDGDIIVSIDGVKIESGRMMSEHLDRNPFNGEAVEFVIERNGEEMTFEVTPILSGESYSLGFGYNSARSKIKGFDVIKYSCSEIRYQIRQVFDSFKLLFRGTLTVNDFTGPVGIVDIIDDVYKQTESMGPLIVFLNLANLSILLSANLGVMNLLPIPGLDGGRLIFLIYEAIVGKPVKKEEYIHLAGLLLLMLFAFYIMFKDIVSCVRS